MGALSSGFSGTLLQLSFPAALQLISIFIPLLYLLKKDEQVKGDIFSRGRVIFPLALAVVVSLALYLGSVVLLLTQNATLDRDMPLVASSIPVVDIVVLLILACFLAIPVYFVLDMLADLRHHREKLPGPKEGGGLEPAIFKLAGDSRAVHACKRDYRNWRAVINKFENHLEFVQQGFDNFEKYLMREHTALCLAAADALQHSSDDAQIALARVFRTEHHHTAEDCMHLVYGSRFAGRTRKSGERRQHVADALAAASLIQLKFALDQYLRAQASGASTPRVSAGEESSEHAAVIP